MNLIGLVGVFRVVEGNQGDCFASTADLVLDLGLDHGESVCVEFVYKSGFIG